MRVGDEPYVIEYNVRMGDPETEAVLPRVESDLLAHCLAVKEGSLDKEVIKISDEASTTVMLVSGGYPESYEKGKVISGLDEVDERSTVFQAGTKLEDGLLKTNGGRVLTVTSKASTLSQALQASYDNMKRIDFEKAYYRRDIGYELEEIK